MELYRKSKRPEREEYNAQDFDGCWLGVYPKVNVKKFNGYCRKGKLKQCEIDIDYDLSSIVGRQVRSVGTNTADSPAGIFISSDGESSRNRYLRADKYISSNSEHCFAYDVLAMRCFCLKGRFEVAQKMLPRILLSFHNSKEAIRVYFRVAALIELHRGVPVLERVLENVALTKESGIKLVFSDLGIYFAMKYVDGIENEENLRKCLAKIDDVLSNQIVERFRSKKPGRKHLETIEGFVLLSYALMNSYFWLLRILKDKFAIGDKDEEFRDVLDDREISLEMTKIDSLFNQIRTHPKRPKAIDSAVFIKSEVLRIQYNFDKLHELLSEYKTESDNHPNAYKMYLTNLRRVKQEKEDRRVIECLQNIISLNPYDTDALLDFHRLVLREQPQNPKRFALLTQAILKSIDCSCTKNSSVNWRMIMELISSISLNTTSHTEVVQILRTYRLNVKTYWEWYHLNDCPDNLITYKLFLHHCLFGKANLPSFNNAKIDEDAIEVANKVFESIGASE